MARAYRDLEQAGVIELRQGAGAFVADPGAGTRVALVKKGQPIAQGAVERLAALGLTPEEIRRLLDAEMMRLADLPRARKP